MDFNGDGVVTIADLALIAKNYNMSGPRPITVIPIVRIRSLFKASPGWGWPSFCTRASSPLQRLSASPASAGRGPAGALLSCSGRCVARRMCPFRRSRTGGSAAICSGGCVTRRPLPAGRGPAGALQCARAGASPAAHCPPVADRRERCNLLRRVRHPPRVPIPPVTDRRERCNLLRRVRHPPRAPIPPVTDRREQPC
jgi:hypothetical protein